MKRLFKWLLAVTGLTGAWLWSRGARNPAEWPRRLPQELTALWDDLEESFSAGRRAADAEEHRFDDQMRSARENRH